MNFFEKIKNKFKKPKYEYEGMGKRKFSLSLMFYAVLLSLAIFYLINYVFPFVSLNGNDEIYLELFVSLS